MPQSCPVGWNRGSQSPASEIRAGNILRIAHGNWGGKVVVANYTLNGNRIAGKTFFYGYHIG